MPLSPQQAGRTDPKLLRAQELLEWLQSQSPGDIRFLKILQYGPVAVRTKTSADEALAILAVHGWITEVSSRPRVFRVRSST